MRVDKYLKAARILKRRTVSRQLAENQRIEVNGRIVKPAKEVYAGDIITITFGRRQMKVRVLSTEEQRRKRETEDMYEIIEKTVMQETGEDS